MAELRWPSERRVPRDPDRAIDPPAETRSRMYRFSERWMMRDFLCRYTGSFYGLHRFGFVLTIAEDLVTITSEKILLLEEFEELALATGGHPVPLP